MTKLQKHSVTPTLLFHLCLKHSFITSTNLWSFMPVMQVLHLNIWFDLRIKVTAIDLYTLWLDDFYKFAKNHQSDPPSTSMPPTNHRACSLITTQHSHDTDLAISPSAVLFLALPLDKYGFLFHFGTTSTWILSLLLFSLLSPIKVLFTSINVLFTSIDV